MFDLYSRSEYAEMNISKLHLRIDELEDEIIRFVRIDSKTAKESIPIPI
jgi:hypothetical protein